MKKNCFVTEEHATIQEKVCLLTLSSHLREETKLNCLVERGSECVSSQKRFSDISAPFS